MSCPRLKDSIVFWLIEKKTTKYKNFLNSGIGVAGIFEWEEGQLANYMQYDVIINFQKEGLLWNRNTLEW